MRPIKTCNHFGCLKQHRLDQEFTNLAFLSFSYSGFNVAKCKDCYLKNDGKACPNCLDSPEKPFSCTILKETETRNSFSFHFLHDNSVENIRFPVTPSNLKYVYIPSFVEKDPKLAPEGRKTRFGKRQAKSSCTNIFKKQNMFLMDNLFHFLMHNKFSNSTIFVYSGMSKDMFFILQALLDNGLSPNIIKNHNQIMLIEEKKLGLRFVEVQNYLHGTFRDLCQRIHKEVPLFPLKWIQQKYFTYNSAPPTVEEYFDFEDTEEDLKAKKKYVEKLTDSWNFAKEYILFLTFKIEIIAIALLEFFKESFCCQREILKHFEALEERKQTFIHPANPPIFTAATYSFQMFLHMSQKGNMIKTVNNPIPFKSSKGEIEYIMYIMWQHPELKLEMAWSPYGQKNLKYTKPDAISSENEIWYYNGCFYHGHSLENCKFKSKVPVEEREKKANDFNQKLQKLQNEPQGYKITVMWECVWRHLKKTNNDVKFFLANVYRNPPMSRLDPRLAGKV